MGSFELLRFAPKLSVIGVSKGLRECGNSPALNEKGQANSHYGILEKTLKGDLDKKYVWHICQSDVYLG